jgi:hypothetical protein
MALHQLLYLPNLRGPEAPAGLKTNRVQPELRGPVISLDMNVRRLIPIARVEEQAIRARPQDCRHEFTLTEWTGRDEMTVTSSA